MIQRVAAYIGAANVLLLGRSSKMKPPKALEQIADIVLSYRPASKRPKPRKRKKAKRVKRAA